MKELFIEPIKVASKHALYLIIVILILHFGIQNIFGVSIPAILKDLIEKELGKDNYLSKKIDYERFAFSPYLGVDLNKIRSDTNGYVNYHQLEFIQNELITVQDFLSDEDKRNFRNFFIDLNDFHYKLILNQFEYNKDKALWELYNVLLNYKCSLDGSISSLYKSGIDKKIAQSFLIEKIFKKLENLLVEVLLYTKSISIEEFNSLKNDGYNRFLKTNEVWKKIVFNYDIAFVYIIRGNMCKQ